MSNETTSLRQAFCQNCGSNRQFVNGKCYYCNSQFKPIGMAPNGNPIFPESKLHNPGTHVKMEGEAKAVIIQLDGRQSFRIVMTDSCKTTIETKVGDGEWTTLHGVQRISVELSVHNPLPKVSIDSIILPPAKVATLKDPGTNNGNGQPSPFQPDEE